MGFWPCSLKKSKPSFRYRKVTSANFFCLGFEQSQTSMLSFFRMGDNCVPRLSCVMPAGTGLMKTVKPVGDAMIDVETAPNSDSS